MLVPFHISYPFSQSFSAILSLMDSDYHFEVVPSMDTNSDTAEDYVMVVSAGEPHPTTPPVRANSLAEDYVTVPGSGEPHTTAPPTPSVPMIGANSTSDGYITVPSGQSRTITTSVLISNNNNSERTPLVSESESTATFFSP
jgi:hypothetical protein